MNCKLNRRGMPIGFNFAMQPIWKIIAMVVLILYFVTTFFKNYYKNKTADKLSQRIVSGLKGTGIVVAIYFVLVGIMYFFMSKVNFSTPVIVMEYTTLELNESDNTVVTEAVYDVDNNKTYQTQADFLLVALAPLVILGSLAFSVFGGAGLAFYPFELIFNWLFRPVRPEPEEHILAKQVLLQASEIIINKARESYDIRRDLDINPNVNPIEKKMRLKELYDDVEVLKKDLISMEDVFQIFKTQDNIVDSNPLYYTLSLVFGIITLLISLLFVIHTFLATQGFFIILEAVFLLIQQINVLFSLFFFLLISIYLALAITKGSNKMGGILSFILDGGPFKLHGTWTDTFLTNNNNLMLSFLGSVVYFVRYMPNYFRFLAADLIFGKIISRIGLIASIYGFNIMEYLFILFFLVGVFATCLIPSGKAVLDKKVKEKKAEIEAEKERLEDLKEDEKKAEDDAK